jgi:hypothetical protein
MVSYHVWLSQERSCVGNLKQLSSLYVKKNDEYLNFTTCELPLIYSHALEMWPNWTEDLIGLDIKS